MACKTAYLIAFTVGIFVGSFFKLWIYRVLKVEWKYCSPLFELVNGIIYTLVMKRMGWSVIGLLFCICTSTLLVIGVVDQRTFEIPIRCNILIGILGGVRFFLDLAHWHEYLAGAFAASSVLLAAHLITKGRAMGDGDIKLMSAAGFLLGWGNILLALFIASCLGVMIHTLLMILKNKGRVLAFGPYLAFGIFVAMLYGEEISGWYPFISG